MTPVLSEGAKKQLLDLIKRQGSLSLDDAAKQLDLAKTTIRQHLLQLETQGLIKRKYERAGQGRPKVVFELSASGQRLYPSQEPTMLRELLEHLNATGQQSSIQSFFEKYWMKRQSQFEAILASLTEGRAPGSKSGELELRMEALRRLLESEGFMPQIERGPGKRVTVRECNCPFPEAIRATQLPCRLESEFIKWALKTAVERTGYIPSGDAACTYSERTR